MTINPQVLRGSLQREANREIVFLVERTDHEALLIHHGPDTALQLISHPLVWNETYDGYPHTIHFDKVFKPVTVNGQPYPAVEAARKLIRFCLERKAEFRYGALTVLIDQLPSGPVHLFDLDGKVFVGRFAAVEDAVMISKALKCRPVMFESPQEFKKLDPQDQAEVCRILDPDRKWPAKLTPNHHKEVFDMATKAVKKTAPKVEKAKAKQRRSDGPVAKAREIFAKMKSSPTADILAACEKAGINRGTATTQLGKWRKENNIVVPRGGARVKKAKEPAKAKGKKDKPAAKAKTPAKGKKDKPAAKAKSSKPMKSITQQAQEAEKKDTQGNEQQPQSPGGEQPGGEQPA